MKLPLLSLLLLALPVGAAAHAQVSTEDFVAPVNAGAKAGAADVRHAAAKVFASVRQPDYARPWTKRQVVESVGSAVILEGGTIVTNAHVVNYASRIEVKPFGADERYDVEIQAISYDQDLAVLVPKEPGFFEKFPGVSMNTALPRTGETVNVIGFPEGGTDISTTEGIISRIEYRRASGFVGLSIQVDAPINEGNSGGPAFIGDEMIGVAFQKDKSARTDNVGYVIPAETVERFLQDAADGTFDGVPWVPVQWAKAENRELRKHLRMGAEHTGPLVYPSAYWSPEGMPLQPFDVLLKVGDADVDNFGKVDLRDDLEVDWEYLVPVVARDGKLPVRVLRDGAPLDLELPTFVDRPTLMTTLDGEYPSYYLYGPLVFVEATRDLVGALDGGTLFAMTSLGHPLVHRMHDMQSRPGERLLVVSGRLLRDDVSKGYGDTLLPALMRVNGEPVLNLEDLARRLENNTSERVVFEFAGRNIVEYPSAPRRGPQNMVFDHAEVLERRELMLEEAGIRRHYSKDLADLVR